MPRPCWRGFIRLSLISCPVHLSFATEEGKLSEEEQKAFEVMSSNVIDLARFVDRAEIDPAYLNTLYYVAPDGELAAEPFRVIAEKMTSKGLAAIARVTFFNTERLLMFEPRGAGMVMYTLRRPDEIHAVDSDTKRQENLDPEMLDIAEVVVERRRGAFDPAGILAEEH
jgi:DNA end-binding protein Ku